MNQPVDGAMPTVSTGATSAPNQASQPDADPLVKVWQDRAAASERVFSKFHQRVKHNRALVRGINTEVEPNSPEYNKQRANLIASTISVVLSKVYAKNPEMSGEPTNKARPLRLFADTVSTVTQTMLEDAKLKQKAKRSVKAAMTCSFGIVKVQWQRDMREDPLILQRIEDTQDNIQRIEGLLAELEDSQARATEEAKKRELEEALAGLQAQREVVAAEGLVIDMVRTERLLPDHTVEDIWDYASGDYLIEKIPMRLSKAKARFPDISSEEFDKATKFQVSAYETDEPRRGLYAGSNSGGEQDPMILVLEAWSKMDNRIFTFVHGINHKFARKPYTPERVGERWYPYFVLPFQSVDGAFVAQSMADVLERLQEEHNETRDKFAQVRRKIRPHLIASADVKEKDITVKVHPEVGEIVMIDTGGAPLKDIVQEGVQLNIDPAVYDTGPIRNDWEMVSGLQDAARSIVVQPKTATEASISDQSLAARVAEFRDQIEDWLTEIAQYSSEVCLLSMTPAMVETIMGAPQQAQPQVVQTPMGALPVGGLAVPKKTYEWPEQRTPETVFNLINMRIRAGSTAAPNKLQAQETWTRAMPLIREMIGVIRQIDAAGGDSEPERELLRETAARFDETIDVDRFLPPKPLAGLPGLPQVPGVAPGMPQPGGPSLAPPTTLQ